MRTFLAVVLLSGLSALVFAGRFPNRFVWDDSLFREGTDPVLYRGLDLETTHTRLYRPLRVLAYTEVFRASKTDETGYHVFATAVHLLTTLAVYALLSAMGLRSPGLGAAVFAVHPIHIESIVFITASFDQIAILLYVLSLAAAVMAQRAKGWRRGAWCTAALGAAGLALMGSEFAATLPLTAALVGIWLQRREGRPVSKGLLIALFGLLTAYLIVRFEVVGLGARATGYVGGSLTAAVATTAVIFVRYLGLLFVPWPSCPLHAPQIYESFARLTATIAGLALIELFWLSAKGMRRGSTVALSFLIFLVTLAPVSNVIPSTTPMAERYLYLPSVGLSILIASVPWLSREIHLLPLWRRLEIAAVGLVIGGYFLLSWQRTAIWRDDLTLFTHTTECAPGNASAWNNLGLAELESGSLLQARMSLQRALQLDRKDPLAWTNSGRLTEMSGGDAVPVYREGIEASGGSSELYVAWTSALLRAGKADEAEQAAREGLTRFAEAGELWGNLGESLLRQDQAEAARTALDEGLKRQPQHPELWATRAETELKMGQPSAALADLEHAVSLPRPSSRAEFNLGVLLEPTSPARAAQHFRRYLELAPGAPDAAAVQARIERDKGRGP